MKLKSFGCSLIFGSELSDEYYPRASQLSWPALWAKELELEYECWAEPGCGNLQILQRVIDQVVDPDSELFVIGWTWIDRFDYCDIVQDESCTTWKTIIPSNTDKLSKLYYRNFSSEYRDKLTTLIYIKTAMDMLDQRGIKYVMTYMDSWLFERRWHVTPGILELQNKIEPKMTTFEGLNFLDWSRSKGYAETKLWHPLEDAHRSAFELIRSYNLL